MQNGERWLTRVGVAAGAAALAFVAGGIATTGAAAAEPSFTVSRGGGGAVISWRSANVAAARGYNLYRRLGSIRIRLNAALIPAVRGPEAHLYRVLDRATLTGVRYWLETVGEDGSKSWRGPARPA